MACLRTVYAMISKWYIHQKVGSQKLLKRNILRIFLLLLKLKFEINSYDKKIRPVYSIGMTRQ